MTCVLFGSLKTTLAAAFWISCRGLTVQAGMPPNRALQLGSLGRTRAWTSCRSCVGRSDREGLIDDEGLKLFTANLHYSSSNVVCESSRFLAVLEGVMLCGEVVIHSKKHVSE